MKRIIVLLLALTMVFSVLTLASCAENTTTDKGGNKDTGDDRIWLDDLSDDIDLGGETVTFVGHGMASAERFGLDGTFIEENDGDSVNAAMYDSVENVKNRFNVEIETITSSDSLVSSISSQLMAGDTDYDVLAGYAYYDATLAASGYLLNINNLDSIGAGGIIDTTKSYWAQDFIDSASYKGNTYWLVGDISIETLGCMYVTYINDTLYQRTCAQTFGSVYDIVSNGQWTIDKLSAMSALCYVDNNGNDEKDAEDTFGWRNHSGHTGDGLVIGLGFEYCQRLVDGSINLTVTTIPKNYDVLSKLTALGKLSTSFITSTEPETIQAFKENRVLTMVNTLRHTELNLREMEDDYYIIPVPKFDEAQENYRTALHDQYVIFGISYASSKVYESAVVLEALCAEHSRLVRPKYYDEALKYKYTRDDASADMIDIVRDSVYTDFALAWSRELNNITWAVRIIPENPTSAFRKTEGSWARALTTLTEKLEENSIG